MRILHICSHKRSIPSPAIFRPAIYGALSSRSASHCESDPTTQTIENIDLIILKRPLTVAVLQLQTRQKTHSQHHGHGMAVKARPQTALILIPTHFFFGFLMELLNGMAAMRIVYQDLQ